MATNWWLCSRICILKNEAAKIKEKRKCRRNMSMYLYGYVFYDRNDTNCAGLDFAFPYNQCHFFNAGNICALRQQNPPVEIYNFETDGPCRKYLLKQESIPVGCVPPVCWPYPIVPHVSQGASTQPRGCRSPCRQTPPQRHTLPWESDPSPLWTGWYMWVKTLPCPKLHLWVVITSCYYGSLQ